MQYKSIQEGDYIVDTRGRVSIVESVIPGLDNEITRIVGIYYDFLSNKSFRLSYSASEESQRMISPTEKITHLYRPSPTSPRGSPIPITNIFPKLKPKSQKRKLEHSVA